jgi:phage gp29-like protein
MYSNLPSGIQILHDGKWSSPPDIPDSVAPGAGGYPVQPVSQFVGQYNQGSKLYLTKFDEALKHDPANARAMRRNPVIVQPLLARYMSTALSSHSVEPENARDREQVAICKEVQRIIEAIPFFTKYKMNLLDANWYGRSANLNRYCWDYRNGKKRLMVKSWSSVHGDTLVFKWDSDDVGLHIGKAGEEARNLETVISDRASAHILTPWERKCLVLNQGFLFGVDYFEPEFAGQLKGVGLRNYCYWPYYLMTEALGWLVEYMERIGTGYTIFTFEQGNPASEDAARKAAESQAFSNTIIMPVPADPGARRHSGVERIEANPGNVDALIKVVRDLFASQINLLILGQTLSQQAENTGLGSAVADLHQNTLAKIIKYDCLNLGECITRELIPVLMEYNFPDAKFCPKFVINPDQPQPDKLLQAAKTFYDMGGSVDEDELRAVIGFGKPTADGKILHVSSTGEQAAQIAAEPDEPQQPMQPGIQAPPGPDMGSLDEAQPVGQDIAGKSANELRASVGGSQALLSLQQAVYAGEVPREAAIANAQLLFGFDPMEAQLLFPDVMPEATAAADPNAPPIAPNAPPGVPNAGNGQSAPEVAAASPFRRQGKPRRFAWVTIGSKEGADGEKHGGTPVDIEDGKIVKGPAHTIGKTPSELKGTPWFGKPAAPELEDKVKGHIEKVLALHGLQPKSINLTDQQGLYANLGGHSGGNFSISRNALDTKPSTTEEQQRRQDHNAKVVPQFESDIANLEAESKKATGEKRRKLQSQIADKKRELHGLKSPTDYIHQTAADPLEAIAGHEAGHHIESELNVDFQKAIREAKDSGKLKEEDYQLSSFGVSHPAEMFAEITAAIHSGQEDKIPPPLREAYDAAIAEAKQPAPEPRAVRKAALMLVNAPERQPGDDVDDEPRSEPMRGADRITKAAQKMPKIWKAQAKEEGIDPVHLQGLADDHMQTDRKHVEEVQAMLKTARDIVKEKSKFGGISLLSKDMKNETPENIRGFDELAQMVRSQHPHLLQDDDYAHQLGQFLIAGVPKPISRLEAYRRAFDEIARNQPKEEPVPFKKRK